MITGAAVALHWVAAWAATTGVSSYIVTGLQVIEYLVFAADAFCFAVFLLSEVSTFVIRSWQQLPRRGS
jgi:hypothetical protein